MKTGNENRKPVCHCDPPKAEKQSRSIRWSLSADRQGLTHQFCIRRGKNHAPPSLPLRRGHGFCTLPTLIHWSLFCPRQEGRILFEFHAAWASLPPALIDAHAIKYLYPIRTQPFLPKSFSNLEDMR